MKLADGGLQITIQIKNLSKKEKKECTHPGFVPDNGSFKCKYCGKEFTLEEVDKIVYDRLEKIGQGSL